MDNIERNENLRDSYCWLCHGLSISNSVHCSTCIRSYHITCFKMPKKRVHPSELKCFECTELEPLENDHDGRPFNIQVIRCLMNRIFEDENNRLFSLPLNKTEHPDYYDQIVHPLSLSEMRHKIVKGKYQSARAFLTDIKWIHHNYSIYFKDNKKHIDAVNDLLTFCQDEIDSIEMCAECFMTANSDPDWFVTVCSQPHLILWAKMDRFPHWPAKLMSITGKKVNVRFFGSHDSAEVPIRMCYLFSSDKFRSYNTTGDVTVGESLIEAKKEANLYIMNLRQRYGGYVYANPKVAFDPTKIEEYLKNLTSPDATDTTTSNEKQPRRNRLNSRRNTIHSDRESMKNANPVRRKSVNFDLDRTEIFEFDQQGPIRKRKRLPEIEKKSPALRSVRMSTPSDRDDDEDEDAFVVAQETAESDEAEENNHDLEPTEVEIRSDGRPATGIRSDVISMIESMMQESIPIPVQETIDSIRTGFDSDLRNYVTTTNSFTRNRLLEMEIEKLQADHDQEVARSNDKHQKLIAVAKTRQWCTHCKANNPAIYYCGSICLNHEVAKLSAARFERNRVN